MNYENAQQTQKAIITDGYHGGVKMRNDFFSVTLYISGSAQC